MRITLFLNRSPISLHLYSSNAIYVREKKTLLFHSHRTCCFTIFHYKDMTNAIMHTNICYHVMVF